VSDLNLTDLYGRLVPEANGRARDALDRAFASVRVCPRKCPRHPLSQAPSQVTYVWG
jgi:hypothetical protein